jgi:hypothetical protein
MESMNQYFAIYCNDISYRVPKSSPNYHFLSFYPEILYLTTEDTEGHFKKKQKSSTAKWAHRL